MKQHPDIGIVGPGPLGFGLGCLLTAAGARVRFYARTGNPVEGCWITRERQRFFRFPQKGDPGIVLLAVKAHALREAIQQHVTKFNAGTLVIYVGNGYVAEVLAEAQQTFPHLKWRWGATTLAVREERKQFLLTSEKATLFWGPVFSKAVPAPDRAHALDQDPADALFAAFTGPDLTLGWTDSILSVVRKKWLFNTALNTLCGALQLARNGEAALYLDILHELLAEAYRLGEEKWGPWPASQTEYWKELLELIHNTSENENSLRRDMRLRRKTESAFMAGLAVGSGDFLRLKQFHSVLMSGY